MSKNKTAAVESIAGKSGLAPGTLVHVGEVEPTRIRCLSYAATGARSFDFQTPPETDGENHWVHVEGLADLASVEEIGRRYQLHVLVQEDILNTRHRPKLEELEDGYFLILRAMSFSDDARLSYTQISMVLRPAAILTFAERHFKPFEIIRKRLEAGQARSLAMGPDYLMYRCCDLAVDEYFNVLETMEEHLEQLSDQVETDETPDMLARLQNFKRELLSFRKYVLPLRELTIELQRNESGFIAETTLPFLRDLEDHVLQVLDRLESLREQTMSLIELHLALVSHRMNEVMKVLTVIATIFIPLTFIAGIYGMNFELMPELKWRWGYAAVWTVMIIIGILMAIWFRRRRWF